MQADKIKWDQRYSNKPLTVPSVPRTLPIFLSDLNPGSVLDVACGDGAAALFLAEHSFNVTAIDISQSALSRLDYFSSQKHLDIDTRCIDLDDVATIESLPLFDNIVICSFKPSMSLFMQLVSRLKPGGKFFFSTFNELKHQETGFSLKFCVQQDEFKASYSNLKLENYQRDSVLGIDSYLFEKHS